MHLTHSKNEAEIRDTMRRCPESAIAAAIEFDRTKNAALAPEIVLGIVERFIEPSARETLRSGRESVRLIEDLGIDSLLMVEIVMMIEDCLQVRVDNEELRNLRTLGQVNRFLLAKLNGEAVPAQKRFFGIEEISAALPFEPSFLFLREATVNGQSAEAFYQVQGDESGLSGALNEPSEFSSILVVEAIHQLALFFLLKSERADLPLVSDEMPTCGVCDGVTHSRGCLAGEYLKLRVELNAVALPAVQFRAEASVEGCAVAEIQRLEYELDPSLGELPLADEA